MWASNWPIHATEAKCRLSWSDGCGPLTRPKNVLGCKWLFLWRCLVYHRPAGHSFCWHQHDTGSSQTGIHKSWESTAFLLLTSTWNWKLSNRNSQKLCEYCIPFADTNMALEALKQEFTKAGRVLHSFCWHQHGTGSSQTGIHKSWESTAFFLLTSTWHWKHSNRNSQKLGEYCIPFADINMELEALKQEFTKAVRVLHSFCWHQHGTGSTQTGIHKSWASTAFLLLTSTWHWKLSNRNSQKLGEYCILFADINMALEALKQEFTKAGRVPMQRSFLLPY